MYNVHNESIANCHKTDTRKTEGEELGADKGKVQDINI